ncbi:MAG: DUF1080 domain-containing protein, partial [Bacteroidales bacterium]
CNPSGSTSKKENTIDSDELITNKSPKHNWVALFDGQTTTGWRGFNMDSIPEGWIAKNGELIGLGHGGDLEGDIVTNDQFEDFELSLEWAISEGGNSGILFHVLEGNYPATYATGPEYQLIDDVGFPKELGLWQQTGANYAMHIASENKKLKPVGEFNSSRIKVKDGWVEHWLNGDMIVTYELWTKAWYDKLKESKWKDYPGYGRAIKGHIGLQDHGSVVKFKNIKIKELTEQGESLFNGIDLSGWKIHGTEKWYAENGELVCVSGPDENYGYLATEKIYKDFILRVSFFQESNGNSGVFFRSGLEGTKISGWQVEVAPPGNNTGGIYESYGRGWLYEIPDEKENILKEGEWNDIVIKVKGDRVITWLNNEMMADLADEKIGKATGVIALQIHDGGGVKVKWKNIFVREL